MLAHVITLCVADANVLSICESGDKMVADECAKVYKKPEKDEKGESRVVPKGMP